MTKVAQVFRAGLIDSKETTVYCVRWNVPPTEDNKRGVVVCAYKSLFQLPKIIHAVCKMEGMDLNQTTDLCTHVSFEDFPHIVQTSLKQRFSTEPLTNLQREELQRLCEERIATCFLKKRLWKRLLPTRWFV